jgi:cytochrome c oxidase subunit 1
MFGRMYNDNVGRFAAVVIFIGFNLTFFVQFVAGSQGMPRRYASYPAEFQTHHVISTIGAYVLAVGLFIVLFNWIAALRKGRTAPANPWGSNTLEWHAHSPPRFDNFPETPTAGDPYDLLAWKWNDKIDGFVLDDEHSQTHTHPKPATGH